MTEKETQEERVARLKNLLSSLEFYKEQVYCRWKSSASCEEGVTIFGDPEENEGHYRDTVLLQELIREALKKAEALSEPPPSPS